MSNVLTGILLVLAGGAMQGSFGVPQKPVKGWAWEKTWLFYSISGMIVCPWLLVAALIPDPLSVYASVPSDVLWRTALFGMGWGVGAVFFGLGMAYVGIALAFAIIISLVAAVGTLVPMLVLHPEQMGTPKGTFVMVGLAIVVAGVVLCARAGSLKKVSATEGSGKEKKFLTGLLICIASGVMSSMMNFSYAFGDRISAEAARRGADAGNASIAIFAVATSAGFLINAAYCLYLLAKNGSWRGTIPAANLPNFFYSIAMGVLWLGGFFLYGLGATALGELGPILGWPIFMTVMVLTANFWGLVTGEWKGAGARALGYLAAGTGVMILAMMVISLAARA
jgi:L-rhamnose-H+ transport protein